MKEENFWKTTPRIFDELLKIHKKINGLNSDDEEIGYIEDVLF